MYTPGPVQGSNSWSSDCSPHWPVADVLLKNIQMCYTVSYINIKMWKQIFVRICYAEF